MNRRQALAPLIGFIGLLIGVATYQLAPRLKAKEVTIPEFAYPDIGDVQRSSSEWAGKILIINFWASWCPPCRKEIPEFVKLQKTYGDRGLQIIGIAIEEKQPAAEYAESMNINYPILIGDKGGMSLAYELGNVVAALPFTVVTDREGKIVHRHPGLFEAEQITEIIAPLLN